MTVLYKREYIPIVKPLGEVIIQVLEEPKAVEKEIKLKDGSVKTIIDYSVTAKPIKGIFESVVEKTILKTKNGDIVETRKYDAEELGEKVIMKISVTAYNVMKTGWENKIISENALLRIITIKKNNKTIYDQIEVLDDKVETKEEGQTEEIEVKGESNEVNEETENENETEEQEENNDTVKEEEETDNDTKSDSKNENVVENKPKSKPKLQLKG